MHAKEVEDACGREDRQGNEVLGLRTVGAGLRRGRGGAGLLGFGAELELLAGSKYSRLRDQAKAHTHTNPKQQP